MGNIASFEDLIPEYANINNTQFEEKDLAPQTKRPTRPNTSTLSKMFPRRIINKIREKHQIIEYRAIDPGHITQFDQKIIKKPFNRPTTSTMQKFDHKFNRKAAQSAGKHYQKVTSKDGVSQLREHKAQIGVTLPVR